MITAPAPLDHAPAGPPSGAVLFARYAFGPNRLGLCGPDDADTLLALGASGADDRALRQLAQGFEGAWPYLELIARGAGIADPLDRRVVEAYWLGGGAVESVTPALIGRSLEERFRPRLGADAWRWLATKPAAGTSPVHAFHVLDVFPRLGLLRGGDGTDVLAVMDSCRIRWGTVVAIAGERVEVSSPALELIDGRLALGAPRIEHVSRAQGGLGFVGDLAVGDSVSLHWDWLCERLGPRQQASLSASTLRQVAIANQTI